jgi:hypothetical protein
MKFSSIVLLCLGSMRMTSSRPHHAPPVTYPTTLRALLPQDSSILDACPCNDDNGCTSLSLGEDTIQRVCFWPNDGGNSLVSIGELSLEQGNQTLTVLPSEYTKAVCNVNGTMMCYVDVALPMEFVDGSSLVARGTGLLETDTKSLLGPASGDGHVDFEVVLNGANESNDTSIPVAAIALVSGMAVLLQSVWFLVHYSYQRRQADLPM